MKNALKFELKALIPFIRMFKSQWQAIALGMLLGMVTIAASIGLLGLSGWFLSATAIAGLTAIGIKSFNFYTPAAGVRFLAVLRTAGRYGERIVTHDATLKLLSNIRIWLWQKLQPLSYSKLARLKRGDILSRLLTDIDILDQLYLRLITPIISFIVLVIAGGLALSIWLPEFAGYLVSSLLVLGLLLPCIGFLLSKRAAIIELLSKKQYRSGLLEYCSQNVELTIFAEREKRQQRLHEIEQSIYQTQRLLVRNQALIQALLFLLHGGVVTFALYFAATSSLTGEIAPPIVAMIVLAVMGTFELLMPIAMSSQYLSACAFAAERVTQLTDNTDNEIFGQYKQLAHSGKLTIEKLRINFDEKPIFSQLDISISHQQKVAIVGRSGCGKTSLLAAITRLISYRGVIKLDEIDVSEYSESALRQSITFIEQQPQIFSGSLKDNLAIAIPSHDTVDDEELKRVLDKVQLTYLLEESGLNLWVGDGGRLLSGGELRRLAFARALLRESSLLLLDEPTEGLDFETEQNLMQLILDIFNESTVIIVTHRMNHLHYFDEVINIEPTRAQ
ncbi:thiol reductant ABC exporter subunit CydC [Shewanella sp. 202IG2-18]|uniref:thiol reductant ABC exporter subunit CydC n=1 Tax=Parashewanella hymeniacidonis TaxID=2807618 RepID=UPI001961BFBF|nr:thiol reductant ABC exporter subunit CydC [Parashewanella hymeniacidonis]MBM7070836.1 thiol reductant ABC exporter subunit CydC [Parashewanella hymeniacidonis]